MKRLLIYFAAIFAFTSCSNHRLVDTVKIQHDSLAHMAQVVDSLQIEIETMRRNAFALSDSIISLNNELYFAKQIPDMSADCFVAKYKIERVRYYMRIANNNQSQRVFLRGWINRVLDE